MATCNGAGGIGAFSKMPPNNWQLLAVMGWTCDSVHLLSTCRCTCDWTCDSVHLLCPWVPTRQDLSIDPAKEPQDSLLRVELFKNDDEWWWWVMMMMRKLSVSQAWAYSWWLFSIFIRTFSFCSCASENTNECFETPLWAVSTLKTAHMCVCVAYVCVCVCVCVYVCVRERAKEREGMASVI